MTGSILKSYITMILIVKVVYTRAREEEQRHDRAEKIIRLENAARERG